MGPLFWSNWNLERLVFVEGGEPGTGEPGEKSSEQGKNQQQTQPTYGTGSESNLCRIDGRGTLSTLHHPCSL